MQHVAPPAEAKTCTVCGTTFHRRVGPAYVRQEDAESYRLRRCCSRECRSAFHQAHPYFAKLRHLAPLPTVDSRLLVNKGNKCLYCEKDAKVRQMCFLHYRRFKVHGTPTGPAKDNGRRCPECGKAVLRRGSVCRVHREDAMIMAGHVFVAEDDILPLNRPRNQPKPKTCSICKAPHDRRGLCHAHYLLYLKQQRMKKAMQSDA